MSLKVMRWFAVITVTMLTAGNLKATQPSEIMARAVALWHMDSLNDAVGKNSRLTERGELRWGVPLEGDERARSLRRGGDGIVAQLSGGWLDAGQGAAGELQIADDQFTALIRLRCERESLWSTRGFFTKGVGHDHLTFNFFSHDFSKGRAEMRVGCEVGLAGEPGLGGQVTAPVLQIDPTAWHDLIARYDGNELVLFVDGVVMDRQEVRGALRSSDDASLCIGSGGPSDRPFACWLDHAAIWDLALSDEEVVQLSGGSAEVDRNRRAFDRWEAQSPGFPIQALVQRSRELERMLIADPHRPRYHLMHFEGGDIMPGDPNGAIFWKGRYHLFYIFQRQQLDPPGTVHCWGHASSIDLVHWTHHPTALDVHAGDPDRSIFSGNALVNRAGVPTLVYHGVDAGNCMATALDDLLIRWEKSPHNPLVPIPKSGEPEYGKYDSWDPHVWLEDDSYFAIFGGNPGTGAPASLFRGNELTELQFSGRFIEDDRWSETDEDISCPDFFPLGQRHMLLCISHKRGARYFLGQWNGERFIPESHGRMNWPGGCFFAPESLIDDQARRIVWGWCLDERPATMRTSSGWSGVMSLPRVLSLDDQGALRIEPVQELQQLRINPVTMKNIELDSNSEQRIEQISGDSLELQIEFPAGIRHEIGVKLRQSPDGSEETLISFDPQSSQLKIDVEKSSVDPAIRYRSWCLVPPADPQQAAQTVTRQEAPLTLADDEPLRLRIFLDRSIVEVFANDRQCMTQRIWPAREDSLGVALFNLGSTVSSIKVNGWEMAASNKN